MLQYKKYILSFFTASLLSVSLTPAYDYEEISCKLLPITRSSIKKTSHPFIPAPSRSIIGRETSTNWAGYVATNNFTKPTKGSATKIVGSWNIPKATPLKGLATYSAFWIGLDGYSSETVEQIGTSCDIDSKGNVSYYAWFEMYPNPSYEIVGFPISPYDIITASVEYIGTNTFAMKIYNQTKKVAYSIPTGYTQSTKSLCNCAEWIAEAPWLNSILPLTNFNTATFSLCSATINGKNLPLQNNSWQAMPIDMISSANKYKAITSGVATNNNSFTVTWKNQ